MNIIKPKSLKSGDTIGIIAPSGRVDRLQFLQGVKFLEEKGFKVVYSDDIFREYRYLAGSDSVRRKEIECYFADKNIDGILCARGGYGAIRLIKDLDYNLIKANPKFFGGYSDITALQLMILKKSKLITFVSPMVVSDFSKENVSEFTYNSFIDVALKEKLPEFSGTTINKGNLTGILWGGNLSTIVSLCGQDFLPEQKFVFFLEDLCEPVYKIDRMLQQLINIDKFKENISGVMFGEFSDVDNENWLNEVLKEFALKLNVPAIKDVKISHSTDKLTIPVGLNVNLSLSY